MHGPSAFDRYKERATTASRRAIVDTVTVPPDCARARKTDDFHRRAAAVTTHGGAPPLDGRARHPAGELHPAGVAAPSPRRGRHRRAHPCRRPREPRPRRGCRRHRRRLPLARLLPGPQPWDTCRLDCVGDGRGARLLPVAAGGEGQAVLRRPGQEDTAVHELQRAQGDGAQLARLPPAALPSPPRVRARLAVQPARFQGHHEHVLQGSPGARVQAIRCDLGEPGSRGELHEGDAGRAGAAHGSQLLPAVPGARAHLRPPGAHGSQRAYHPAHGPGRRRPAGAPRRQVGRRQPAARRAHHQHRRPAAGAEQRAVPECVAPCGGELGPGADVGGVVPVPVQPRRARPRAEARHGGHPGRVQELHVRRILQEVLEQEPGPGALPGAVQNLATCGVRANAYGLICFAVFLHDIRLVRLVYKPYFFS